MLHSNARTALHEEIFPYRRSSTSPSLPPPPPPSSRRAMARLVLIYCGGKSGWTPWPTRLAYSLEGLYGGGILLQRQA
jgi:hypothetical protein